MKALKDWRSTEKKNSITKALVHILTFPETLKTIIICLLDHRDQCSMKSFVFPSLSRKVAPTIRFRHQSRAITIWLTLMGPKHSYFFSCIFFLAAWLSSERKRYCTTECWHVNRMMNESRARRGRFISLTTFIHREKWTCIM